MKATIEHRGQSYAIDLNSPLDLSIGISSAGPRAWYVDPVRIAPVINQHFTGSVRLGGSVNFNEITFNPHGHGTHTESFGHILKENESVNAVLKQFFFMVEIISITPERLSGDNGWMKKGDLIISRDQIVAARKHASEALIIRTLPNAIDKRSRNYSDTNFCYFSEQALGWMAENGIEHLLVDLPSVDRESDGGLLKAHHAFWKNGMEERRNCTITEFIFVDDNIKDGLYVLNLQVAPFENDASPSRPVVFKTL